MVSSSVAPDSCPAASADACWLMKKRLLISSVDGDSALPVACAGQTSWQRLHMMQAYASISWGQARCSILAAPYWVTRSSSKSIGSRVPTERRAGLVR